MKIEVLSRKLTDAKCLASSRSLSYPGYDTCARTRAHTARTHTYLKHLTWNMWTNASNTFNFDTVLRCVIRFRLRSLSPRERPPRTLSQVGRQDGPTAIQIIEFPAPNGNRTSAIHFVVSQYSHIDGAVSFPTCIRFKFL